MEGVGVALSVELAGAPALFVYREGEGEAEAGFGELHFLDFERGLLGPHDALEAEGAIAFAVPAAV